MRLVSFCLCLAAVLPSLAAVHRERWRVMWDDGRVIDGVNRGGTIDLRELTDRSSGRVLAETWVLSPTQRTVSAWVDLGEQGTASGSCAALNGQEVKAGRRPVELRAGWNHLKMALVGPKTAGQGDWRGVFLLRESDDDEARDVADLIYVSDPQVNDLRPFDVQGAIDAAKPGEAVRIPAGNWEAKPFRLKSNSRIELDPGAVVYASTNISDYAKAEGQRYFIGAVGATNVSIAGAGVFDGRGQLFRFRECNRSEDQPKKLPVMMRFIRCRNLYLSGFTYRCGGAWGCHLCNCDGVTIRTVTCYNHSNRTNDGIDIESSNVVIDDCRIDADDDAICIKTETDPAFAVTNVYIRNTTLASCCNGFKFGTGSYGMVRDIRMEGCVIARANGNYSMGKRAHMSGPAKALSGISAVAIECVDGGTVEDVSLRDIRFDGYLTPFFVRLARRHEPVDGRVSYLRNVLVENMRGRADSPIASSITGVPGLRPENIVVRDCDFTFPGGGSERDVEMLVGEMEKSYPDACMFDNLHLPAWAFYVRHADRVVFDNVTCRRLLPDARRKYVFDDADVKIRPWQENDNVKSPSDKGE